MPSAPQRQQIKLIVSTMLHLDYRTSLVTEVLNRCVSANKNNLPGLASEPQFIA